MVDDSIIQAPVDDRGSLAGFYCFAKTMSHRNLEGHSSDGKLRKFINRFLLGHPTVSLVAKYHRLTKYNYSIRLFFLILPCLRVNYLEHACMQGGVLYMTVRRSAAVMVTLIPKRKDPQLWTCMVNFRRAGSNYCSQSRRTCCMTFRYPTKTSNRSPASYLDAIAQRLATITATVQLSRQWFDSIKKRGCLNVVPVVLCNHTEILHSCL